MARTLRRFAVPLAFVLLFLLAANPAARAASGGGIFRFSDWLEVLNRLWAPAGCIADPNGGCRDGNSAPPRDAGCGLDPGGKCAAVPILESAGCIADPGGRCRDSFLPQRDAGCGIDSGGNCKQ